MNGNSTGGCHFSSRIGCRLPGAVETALRHHMGQRPLEENIIAESAEQAELRGREAAAAPIGLVAAGPPWEAGADQRVVPSHWSYERQAVIGRGGAERQRKPGGEARDHGVGFGGAEE